MKGPRLSPRQRREREEMRMQQRGDRQMQQRRRAKWGQAMATAGLIAGVSVLAIDANAGVRIKRALHATGVDADAQGEAVVVTNGNAGRGKLVVLGRKLEPRSRSGVTLGGVRIGTLSTNARGKGRARFSSRPGPGEQTLGTDPRGEHLEVADDQGEDVLRDDVPEQVACCLPDDNGMECEQTTAAECTDRHGVKVDTCNPNPCTPGSGHESSDDSGSGTGRSGSSGSDETENETGDDSGSGTGRSGSSGSDETEHETPECGQLTGDHCMQEGGTPTGEGSCDSNPCIASP